MKVKDFIEKLQMTADLNTCYVQGGFGCRLKSPGGDWYSTTYSWNKKNKAVIEAHTNTVPVSFGFDCVCLIKGILWGFQGDPDKVYGGAVYESNDVPDMTIKKLAKSCADFSTDWAVDPDPGEITFYDREMTHVGVYVGDGIVIEATPAWACGVQRTLLPDWVNPDPIPVRKWYAHGHTSYIDYTVNTWEEAYKLLSDKFANLELENALLREKLKKIKELCN